MFTLHPRVNGLSPTAAAFHLTAVAALASGFIIALFGIFAVIYSIALHKERKSLHRLAEFFLIGTIIGISGSLANAVQDFLGNGLGQVIGLMAGGIAGGFFSACADGVKHVITHLSPSRLAGLGFTLVGIGAVLEAAAIALRIFLH